MKLGVDEGNNMEHKPKSLQILPDQVFTQRTGIITTHHGNQQQEATNVQVQSKAHTVQDQRSIERTEQQISAHPMRKMIDTSTPHPLNLHSPMRGWLRKLHRPLIGRCRQIQVLTKVPEVGANHSTIPERPLGQLLPRRATR